jgi:hypothetical protein
MARMTVISIALLHVERCSAKVATPSDTVKDKEPMRLPSSRPFDRSILIMPPATLPRKPLIEG